MFIYLLAFQREMTYAALNDSNRFSSLAVLASYRYKAFPSLPIFPIHIDKLYYAKGYLYYVLRELY